MKRSLLGAVVLWVALTSVSPADDWPSYRGPTGMGTVAESNVPLTWNAEGENLLWKVELPVVAANGRPDHSQSSPIIWQQHVFVTTAYWSQDSEREAIPQQHVTCYDFDSGKLRWDTIVPAGPWKLGDLRGGYAAPTPCTDGERVYVFFGSSILAALDFDGKLVWTKEIPDWQDFDVCIASSPVLHEGRLFLLADRNVNKSTLTAFDPATGEVIWNRQRESGFAHSTPVFSRLDNRWLMLTTGSNKITAVDPRSGEPVWWIQAKGDVVSPVSTGGRIYSDSGRGGGGLCFEPAGSGELSEESVKWRTDNIPEGLSSPVIAGGLLYRLHNPAILMCIDMASGEVLYKERLAGVSVAASPIALPDGSVLCASAGKTYVIAAGRDFKVISENDLGEPHKSSPAVSQGRIVLKGSRHLFCIGSK